MATSVDVDAFGKSDPGRTFDLDPISPRLATLPAGWEEGLVRIELEPGLAAWFLEPNDAAVSKHARMEPRDREWIRPGLRAGILSLPIIDARFGQTAFLDGGESARAHEAFQQDREWLRARHRRVRSARTR